MPRIPVLKPHFGAGYGFVQVGDMITVTDIRHKELARRGLVPKTTDKVAVMSDQPTPGVITNATFKPRREPVAAIPVAGQSTQSTAASATASAAAVETQASASTPAAKTDKSQK